MSSEVPNPKQRAVFLVDGFNLYHALDAQPVFHEYKWLDLTALAKAFIMPSREEVVGIYFFTALPPWDEHKRARHQRLIDAYVDLGIHIRHGDFKPTTAFCRRCQKEYETYQEKMTDINICLTLQQVGDENLADRVYLITGDNDQVPSIRRFKRLYTGKTVVVVIPPNRHANELKKMAHETRKISREQLAASVLANPYQTRHGRKIEKPLNWTASDILKKRQF